MTTEHSNKILYNKMILSLVCEVCAMHWLYTREWYMAQRLTCIRVHACICYLPFSAECVRLSVSSILSVLLVVVAVVLHSFAVMPSSFFTIKSTNNICVSIPDQHFFFWERGLWTQKLVHIKFCFGFIKFQHLCVYQSIDRPINHSIELKVANNRWKANEMKKKRKKLFWHKECPNGT